MRLTAACIKVCSDTARRLRHLQIWYSIAGTQRLCRTTAHQWTGISRASHSIQSACGARSLIPCLRSAARPPRPEHRLLRSARRNKNNRGGCKTPRTIKTFSRNSHTPRTTGSSGFRSRHKYRWVIPCHAVYSGPIRIKTTAPCGGLNAITAPPAAASTAMFPKAQKNPLHRLKPSFGYSANRIFVPPNEFALMPQLKPRHRDCHGRGQNGTEVL